MTITAARAQALPVSAAQDGMWFAQALDPDGPTLVTGEYLVINGAIDPATFIEALRIVASEAQTLQMNLIEVGGERRQVPQPLDPFPVQVLDLRDQDDPATAARVWLERDALRPFTLGEGLLFRHVLVRVADDQWWWWQVVHHLVIDGYALGLLARRAAEVYTALRQGEPVGDTPFGQLADIVAEDQEYAAGPDRAADQAAWSGLMDQGPAPTLSGRRALPARTAIRRTTTLPGGTRDRLAQTARAADGTWADLALLAHAIYLSRATRTEQVVLGLPMMNRIGSVSARTPAMVMNVVPLPLTVADGTVGDLLSQVIHRTRVARQHGRYRLEDIRRDRHALGTDRGVVGPLVNVLPVSYRARFDGHASVAHKVTTGAVEDFTCHLIDHGDVLRLQVEANPRCYTEPEVEAHLHRLAHLLDAVAGGSLETAVGDIRVATPAEQRLVVGELNDTARELPVRPLTASFEEVARAHPDRTALVTAAGRLTYGELDARVEQVARALVAQGVRPGDLVGVALPRNCELITAVYAVLRAGAAYVPLETEYPTGRTLSVIEDSQPRCVIATAEAATDPDWAPAYAMTSVVTIDTLTAADETSRPGGASPESSRPGGAWPTPKPTDAAYVIYTSGTTGRPKGVVVSHAAIDNRLQWMQGAYPLDASDVVLHKTPIGFDVSVWELFWPLREGAKQVLAEPGGHRDPAYLRELIEREQVTTCHFVPSMLRVFLDHGLQSAGRESPAAMPAQDESPATGTAGAPALARHHESPAVPTVLRTVFCSGEALGRDLADDFYRAAGDTRLVNLYGPTEAAVDVTCHEVHPGEQGPVPIGRPVWNTHCYVLDPAGNPCPPGLPGELHLAGVQLANGYLGRADLTADRFVPNPFAAGPFAAGPFAAGPFAADRSAVAEPEPLTDRQISPAPDARMYRTGDLAAWTFAGELAYLGRIDHQVKLNGQRLEPAEIEAHLTAHDTVREAAVLLREDLPGDPRLVAYVTGADAEPQALLRQLSGRLPQFMVPSAIVVLDAFPLSANGKLDRAALPAPQLDLGAQAPRTDLERRVVAAFEDVLGVSGLGVDANFFDLGGTSLRVAALADQLSRRADPNAGPGGPLAQQAETNGRSGDPRSQPAESDATPEPASQVTMGMLFAAPTPRTLAAALTEPGPGGGSAEHDREALAPMLTLRESGSQPPLFVFHPAGGLSWCYSGLLSGLGPDQPVIGLQADGLSDDTPLPGTMETLAAAYVDRLLAAYPSGPFRLLGWSVGGDIAHTAAVQLRERGHTVDLLCLLDAYPADQWRDQQAPTETDTLKALLRMAGLDTDGQELTTDQVLRLLRGADSSLATLPDDVLARVPAVVRNNASLMRSAQHRAYDGDVLMVVAAAPREQDWLTPTAWQPYVTGQVEVHEFPCTHAELAQVDRLDQLARLLRPRLTPVS